MRSCARHVYAMFLATQSATCKKPSADFFPACRATGVREGSICRGRFLHKEAKSGRRRRGSGESPLPFALPHMCGDQPPLGPSSSRSCSRCPSGATVESAAGQHDRDLSCGAAADRPLAGAVHDAAPRGCRPAARRPRARQAAANSPVAPIRMAAERDPLASRGIKLRGLMLCSLMLRRIFSGRRARPSDRKMLRQKGSPAGCRASPWSAWPVLTC